MAKKSELPIVTEARKKAEKKAEAQQKKRAIALAKEQKDNAKKELSNYGDSHEFAIKGECLDKDGNKTKVLIIDLDKKGYIGLFMELGNPFSLSENGMSRADGKILSEYLRFMANIDLDDDDNVEEVGLTAISEARELVSGFFMLHLVAAMNIASETESE